MRYFRNYRKPVELEVFTSVSLLIATVTALFMYNGPLKEIYTHIFNSIYIIKDFNLHMFVNDFLMAIFFLVAGLEIKQEILFGNLSSLRKASFPVIASLGGVIVPALIFGIINWNTSFFNGICIPISTDIAFSIGIFFIFRKKLNPDLKVFLLSLAVVDDLVSIVAIGVVYSIDVNYVYISISLIILLTLYMANKCFKVDSISYYLISGFCLWYFIYLSGIHPTISGVLLAIVIPTHQNSNKSCIEKLQRFLVPINSIIIIPLFAFANTGISINFNTVDLLSYTNLSLGIILGLCIGKPLGIMIFSYIACLCGITEKPYNISWGSVFLVSTIAGIGFTMSIFISEIAFINNPILINISKMSILISSIFSMLLSIISINLYSFISRRKYTNNTHNINKNYIS